MTDGERVLVRLEALTEARDVAAGAVADMRKLLAFGKAPIESWTRQRLELAEKIMRGIEALENAPAPLRTFDEITSPDNVLPIRPRGAGRRRK